MESPGRRSSLLQQIVDVLAFVDLLAVGEPTLTICAKGGRNGPQDQATPDSPHR
jgi:hypothetical protein